MNKKTQLALGVAGAALATGLSVPAHAVCDVDGSVVTCTADSTAAEVNTAMASVAGDDVTLEIVTTANVTQPGTVIPGQQGAVAIDNAGDVGTEVAPVSVVYGGTSADADNTFDLDNSGTISGAVNVFDVGGAVSMDNSGFIGSGVFVSTSADADVAFSSTGDVDTAGSTGVSINTRGDIDIDIDGNVGTPATGMAASDLKDVSANTNATVFEAPTVTVVVDGAVTTTTSTSGFAPQGGTATINLGEDANTGAVFANGVDGASVNVDGSVGSATQYDGVSASSNNTAQDVEVVTVTEGADFDQVQTIETIAVGGQASVAIGETGSVAGNVDANGVAGADVTVDGTVGSEANPASVFASSNRTDTLQVFTSSATGTVSASSNSTTNTASGGTTSVAVGETGSVTGSINASGNGDSSVVVDGTVGLPGNTSNISASSTGTDSTSDNESVFDGATGESANASQSTSSSVGGNATVEIGETGVANASVNATANGDAAVLNSGTIVRSVSANASGSDSASSSSSTNDGSGNTTFSSSSSSTSTGGTASIVNAEDALIGLDATSPVSVSAFGNAGASVDNAGRINGNVSATSSGNANAQTNDSSFTSTTVAATGVTTDVSENANSSSNAATGGEAEFTNASGALVTGSVNVSGQGGASVTNEGAVIGTTFAGSQATDSMSANSSVTTTVSDPGDAVDLTDDTTTTTFEETQSYAEMSSGGDVTGIYAGTNGAVQFAPFGGSSNGSVTQRANGDSSAVVSGTIFGNFSGNASGREYGWTYENTQVTLRDAENDLRSFDRSYTYDESEVVTDSNSSLAVDGGLITGSASLFATGSASAQVGNGGVIEGNLTVQAQGYGGYDYAETYEQADVYDEDGNFVSSDRVYTEGYQEFVNDGDVSVAIGEGFVGSVSMFGAGGSNVFTLAEDGAVGGSVSQQSSYSAYGYDQTETTSITSSTVRTVDYAETNVASGGDVSATVAGVIGNGDNGPLAYGDLSSANGTSLSLYTDAGNAEATITGQVRNGISVVANGSDSTYSFSRTTTNGSTTAYSEESTSVATGGTATLIVDAADLDTPANFGDIEVAGVGGSTVTIGANSSVLAETNTSFMEVGGYFQNTASTREDIFDGTTLTGRNTTFDRTIVGGDATLTNEGRIGYDGGTFFGGNNVFVSVVSPTAAEVTNSGQIFGSVSLGSLFEDTSSTTTQTSLDDSPLRVDTTQTIYTANGGTALLTNNGLITGDAEVAALDGTVINNGVLRGDIFLGDNVDNYTTESVDTLTQLGEEEVLDLADAIEQGYAVEQNGLLGGTVFVGGAFGNIDDTVQTSNITADIALNSGSVTGGGVWAEYDQETGERFTSTSVTLNGSGYLGLGDQALEELGDAFADTDPRIGLLGDLFEFSGGARVLGVDTLTKTGSGVFLITGADYAPLSNTNTIPDYTLDVGTFSITGGEIQLATANPDAVFGIRGDISNTAGLVLGSRVTLPAPLFGTNASVTAIDGVEVYQNGDFSQSSSGTLTVGITPTLVRVVDPAFSSVSSATNPLAVQQIGLASGLFTTPETAFGQAFTDLGTGFITVDGDMTLAGTVALVSPTAGLFTDGQTIDIASVSGTVNASADVDVNSASNFVTFDLGTRSEGGRTIVFASADRAGFETVGLNQNAVAAGTALTQALPGVVSAIQAGSLGGIGFNGDNFVAAQDLANIYVAFDTLLTTAQVSAALNELASGEFYGSLTTIETTAPFVDAISSRRVPATASGFNVWFAPSGDFLEIDGDASVGSRDFEADNYGASAGFGVATGNGEIGLGFGYGRIEANSGDDLLNAKADTWMVGVYGRQAFGNISVGADVVYGWSDWDASRVMPTMSRSATSAFDSTELRGNLRIEYMADLGMAWVAPFGQLTVRKFDLDGFTEEGAGAVSLVVDEADDTILTPTLGLRVGSEFTTGLAVLRPELTLSYSFDDDDASFRTVAYSGAPMTSFNLQGVEPEGYFTIGAGLFADIGTNSGAFVRASYSTGENVDATSLNAGVTIGF